MKKFISATIVVAALAGAANAQDSLAYWSFTNQGLPGGGFGFQPGEFPFGAEFGDQAGSATLNVGGGITADTTVSGGGDTVYTWIQSFAGSTVNAQFGEPSGGSISVQGGTNNGNNGAWIDFEFDGTLWGNLDFSFAGRRTSSGFNSVSIDAYDGAVFLGNIVASLDMTTSTALALYAYDVSVLDGVADARLRFTLNGATSSTGNVRLDNLYIQGDLVPTPGAFALLGMGGLVAARRRRA